MRLNKQRGILAIPLLQNACDKQQQSAGQTRRSFASRRLGASGKTDILREEITNLQSYGTEQTMIKWLRYLSLKCTNATGDVYYQDGRYLCGKSCN